MKVREVALVYIYIERERETERERRSFEVNTQCSEDCMQGLSHSCRFVSIRFSLKKTNKQTVTGGGKKLHYLLYTMSHNYMEVYTYR